MTTFEFLSYLRSLGVKVWAEGAKLRYQAPPSALTPALLEDLAQRKSEILQVLNELETNSQPARLPLQPTARSNESPLSFSQKPLWFFDRLNQGSPVYNEAIAFRLQGKLVLPALERALSEIVRRHEAVRTTFASVGGVPMQVIRQAYAVSLPVDDLSHLSESEREVEAERRMASEGQRSFDLENGPLMRAMLLRLSKDEHVMVVTMHHIITDGGSVVVLAREIGALYQAIASDEPSPLPELDIQYIDYAEWQRSYLVGNVLELQLGYWKRRLAGAPPVLELPTDRPRPARQSFNGARLSLTLGPELSQSLQAMSQEQGVTLFMASFAVFQILLRRYTGQTDIVVGSPVANRTAPEIERMIGFFVNPLVLRTDLSGNPSFRETLDRVRETTLGAYAHQDLPFERLIEELQPERDLSYMPLVQVVFVLLNAPPASELDGLNLSVTDIELGVARVDLHCSLVKTAQGLKARIDYNTDLFDEWRIRRMSEHFRALIEAVTANPEKRILDIDLLNERERRQILVEWNKTEREYPEALPAHLMIAEQAKRTPERIALIGEGQRLSYGELNRRANQLANYLRGLGVGPEVVVGLCMERSVEMGVAIIGVLKAGGAYLPLDPEYPLERLSYMLEDAGVSVALTQEDVGDRLPAFWGQTVYLGSEWERIGAESESIQESGQESQCVADNLAYVIYTSGSTGKPKGVMVAHQGLCNLVEAQKDIFGIGDQSRVLQFASLSFDASVWEIFSTLAAGGSLHVYGHERLLPGADLVRVVKEDQITTVTLPPTALAMLSPGELGNLQTVIAAGEACGAEVVERWARGRRFFNAYGPTESTVCASIGACESESQGNPTIGRPIANTKVYILDREMNPVPTGVIGDLYISGAGLARGYLGKPELTAERFFPNPFDDQGGGRLYRTGDVCRYLLDGEIAFIGRADEQVKVRGYRIEPVEIENVLSEQPGVRQAVVVAREDEPGQKRLVAYVVADFSARESEATGPDVDCEIELWPSSADRIDDQSLAKSISADLRRAVERRLPSYMTPSAIVLVSRLPVTPNGKLDRNGLPYPDGLRPASDISYIAPRTDLEQSIAAVWGELLGVEQVGVHDNFFELGAHSLMMVQASSRLEELIRRELPVLKLFQYPTISALAAYLSQGLADGSELPRRDADSENCEARILSGERDGGKRGVTSVSGMTGSNGNARRRLSRPSDIAIIGMSGRFPQAPNIDSFWRNLCDAREAITPLSDSQLLAAGVDPKSLTDPHYVKVAVPLDGVDLFDASFFGFNPREAEVLDPQHRLFLQTAWHALESAGYVPDRFPGAIGLYAGAGYNYYFPDVISVNPEFLALAGRFQAGLANEKDFMPARVSYKLNLRGPSFAVQTACSTSLVAVHLACQSLSNGECDMALAGGVSIVIPQNVGYSYQEVGVASSDGHCRAFDARASGIVTGSGVGLVVLKRLAEAQADGDNILAVIKGSAINNDGYNKVSFTAPSIDGQARVIAEAQAQAGIDQTTITYIEAHGTGTALGDPIEIAALTQAFRSATDKRGFCAIGSVKTNIGHLDAAAGVTGVIKTVLALKHRQIPASLHFERPNPQIDFENSPFYVNVSLRQWETNGAPRRAGVNSFGIGGTNAHVILEEAPSIEPSEAVGGWHLLVLSARSNRALTTMAARLAAYLKQRPELNLADVAFTLQEGRKNFAHRLSVVCRDLSEAIEILEERGGRRPYRAVAGERATPVVYLFPEEGAQYVGMGRELYEQEPEYRSVIDRFAETVAGELRIDLRRVLYPGPEEEAQALELIGQRRLTPLALVAVELGLARMWQSKGVYPEAMIGHGVSEYAAACLAGDMSEEQIIKQMVRRIAPPQRSVEGTEQINREGKERVWLEMGPGEALSRMGHQVNGKGRQEVVSSLGREVEGGMRVIMEAVGKLWANGVDIEWGKWRKGKRRRVELPGYAFEEARYWVDGIKAQAGAGVVKRKGDLADWFYVPVWKETATVMKRGEPIDARWWLIMEDETGIGGRIAAELERQGCVVTRVKRAGRYERKGEREYWIRAGEMEDYESILKELEARGEAPEKIVHLFSLKRKGEQGSQEWQKRIEEAAEDGFYSLAYVVRAMGQRADAKQVEVVVVSNEVAYVAGTEEVRAEKSLVMGPVRVMRQEYPQMKSRCIDVNIPAPGSWQEERLIEQLIGELGTESGDQMIAYRGSQRWVRTYEAAPLAATSAGKGFRARGVYLITGGLGGVGMALAEYLARTVKARLVLTRRNEFPERAEWDRLVAQAETAEEIKRKIIKIQELERAGAEVEVISADVSEEEQMREVVRRTRQRFGPINGVIHLAGIADERAFKLIQEITPESSSLIFRPKVHGLFVLEKALQDEDLDFCLLFSSLASVLGGIGFAAYSGSNIFMDTFVCARNQISPVPWVSVNWGGWQVEEEDSQPSAEYGSAPAAPEYKRKEAVEALQRIISMKMFGQVAVSTEDLHSRIRRTVEAPSAQQPMFSEPKAAIADAFYLPAWKKEITRIPEASEELLAGAQTSWLILLDEQGLGERLAARLRQAHQTVTTVARGTVFRQEGADRYTINPGVSVDYQELLNALPTLPVKIIHLWNLPQDDGAWNTLEGLDTSLERSFSSLLWLAQALGERQLSQTVELVVVSSQLHVVTGEESICPAKAALLGPCRVIQSEYLQLTCRNIDLWPLPSDSQENERLVELLLAELSRASAEPVVAYRGAQRWVETFEPTQLSEPTVGQAKWREGGVYLITGGLGGIGLALAGHLAANWKARLVLVGRSRLPERAEWPSLLASESEPRALKGKLAKLQELEAAGTEVLALSADVANLEQMEAVVRQARERFGAIHGVIHTAGAPGMGVMQLKSLDQAANVLAPKVKGTLVLERVLSGEDVELMVLCSSVTAQTGGGPGQSDYCAANAYLDAYAERWRGHGRATISINWCEWQWNAWEAGLVGLDRESQEYFKAHRRRFGISFEEGQEALDRIVASGRRRMIVSTQEFNRVVEDSRRLTAARMLEKSQEKGQPHSPLLGRSGHSRPELSTDYLAPRNDLERSIAAVWQDLLGIEGIGVHDNFFELGGHSLLVIQCSYRLRQSFQIEIPVRSLFEKSTIAEHGELIEELMIEDLELLTEEQAVRLREAI